MQPQIKPSGHWKRLANLQQEANKYRTRTEFATKASGAYSTAKRKGWLDKICGHMVLKGNRFYRAIYVFEFENHSAYVGLSYDIERRYQDHLKGKGPVGRAAKNGKFRFEQLTDYVPRKQARKLEDFYLKKYRREGWLILNTAKAGALGTGEKVTIEELKSKIKKCETLKEFSDNYPSEYSIAKRRGLHRLFHHLKRIKAADGSLTKVHCARAAKKCESKIAFKKQFGSEYSTCVRRGWIQDVCKHMIRPLVHNYKYDYEKCVRDAAKCSNATEFKKRFSGSFHASHKNGWFAKITRHFVRLHKRPVHWTFEACLAKAKLCKSKAQFRKADYNAYKFALRQGFLEQIEFELGWRKPIL